MVVNGGDLALSLDTDFSRGIPLDHSKCEFSQEGKILYSVPLMNMTGVFMEGNIQAPMQLVFDTPVVADQFAEGSSIGLKAADKESAFRARISISGTGSFNADKRPQKTPSPQASSSTSPPLFPFGLV